MDAGIGGFDLGRVADSSGADRFGHYCGVTRVLACQSRPVAEQDTGLLQSDGVTAADLAALQDGRIDPDVGPVVLRGCAQDTWIPREIALGKRGHYATGAGTGDAEANGIADCENLPDPGILHEVLLAVCGLYHDIWAKPPGFEAPRWIEFA